MNVTAPAKLGEAKLANNSTYIGERMQGSMFVRWENVLRIIEK